MALWCATLSFVRFCCALRTPRISKTFGDEGSVHHTYWNNHSMKALNWDHGKLMSLKCNLSEEVRWSKKLSEALGEPCWYKMKSNRVVMISWAAQMVSTETKWIWLRLITLVFAISSSNRNYVFNEWKSGVEIDALMNQPTAKVHKSARARANASMQRLDIAN